MSLSPEAIGFLLVIGAGMSTGIGAAVVYSTRLIKATSKTILAGALGLSSGVMLYVSFVEILQKSISSFQEQYADNNAYLYATLCFFGGVLIMKLLNFVVHWLDKSHMACQDLDMDFVDELTKRGCEQEMITQNTSAVSLINDKGYENEKTQEPICP